MPALCGKSSYITIGSCTVVPMTDWTLTYGSEPQTFHTAGSGGAQETCAGGEKGSGTINCVTDNQAILASAAASGDLVYITVFAEASGKYAVGFARIGQIESRGELGGGAQTQSYPFTTHGKWGGTLLGISTTLASSHYAT